MLTTLVCTYVGIIIGIIIYTYIRQCKKSKNPMYAILFCLYILGGIVLGTIELLIIVHLTRMLGE